MLPKINTGLLVFSAIQNMKRKLLREGKLQKKSDLSARDRRSRKSKKGKTEETGKDIS